ncbi:MAG: hypothetical protein ABI662_07800 [Dermatophilaceae bacterium]
MIITGLVLVGILGAGFFYLRGPSEAQMSKALYAIKLPDNFHVVGTVYIHSSGSFAGDCFDTCSGGNLLAENRQGTSGSDNEKNLEAADALVKGEGWQLVHSYKNDSSYTSQKTQGESSSNIGSVKNTYCKSRMQLEVVSGLRHPYGSDITQRTDADRLAGLEYSLESRSCSY